MTWRDLKTDPPSKDLYCVILFPIKSEVGLFYICSNPTYACVNGLKDGYTHWMEFELAPDHEKMIKWQNGLNEHDF